MAAAVSADVRAGPPPDEVTAVRAARWYTLAAAVVGVLNYGYALVLTRLLDVGAYSRFAAGQGLILSASTVAVVAVPWVLAQTLARAGSSVERGDAIRFTIVIGIGGGLVASAGVAAVASQFAGPATLVALAVSTLLIFASTVTVGWLQGFERLRTLSALTVGEAGLKTGAGLVLASATGLGDAGALAAFGVGVLPFLLWWPPVPPGSCQWWRGAGATRDLWRRALGIAGVQGLVALLAAMDVVLVALLPTDPGAAASYQASVVAARSPLFLASAISVAFFPALSRRRAASPLTRRALEMYVVAALPLTAVLVTAPAAVISAAFPARYGMVAELVRYTALSGFAFGGVNLVTTFFQADDDYSCTRWQAAGVLGYLIALLVGWRVGGILGFAIGAACGAYAALVLLIYHLARRKRIAVVGRMRLLEPLALAGLLTVLRPHLVLWLIAAGGVALRAAERFLLRPGTLQGRLGEGARSGPVEIPDNGGTTDMTDLRRVVEADQPAGRPDVRRPRRWSATARAQPSAGQLLVDAVWRRRVRPAADALVQDALTQARRNRVEGLLARAYPRQLEEVVSRVQEASESFRHNLCQVAERLQTAGIPAVLIKADVQHDYVYGNFDLVVRAEHWPAARAALEDWYVHRSTYWLERSTKLLLEPRSGPSAHLHTAVSWFGVPVIGPTGLFDRAVPDDTHPWLVPHPAEQLRIWLAHAVFQNLALDLSELLALRDLLAPDVVAEAERGAAREGWATGFGGAFQTAVETMHMLDRGLDAQLPVPLPVALCLRAGAQHARHLLYQGRRRTAMREMMLRVPLVVAKRRKVLVG
jgi:O-antigen/teichoic acid export membrane protein